MKGVLLLFVMASDRTKTIRWGILGTGKIANDFCNVLRRNSNAEIVAIGSRSWESAKSFARRLDIQQATIYDSDDAFARDDAIDIVYIATPSSRHVEDSLRCLKAGRHVLCEKSMAYDAEQTAAVLSTARDKNCFFLHGVWSRFFPAMHQIRSLIESGVIGDVYSAHASFCQNEGAGSCSAMAETGIYCVQFLTFIFAGRDATVKGVAYVADHDGSSGFDSHTAATLAFQGGGIGTFECSLRHASARDAIICGTQGVIRVKYPFWCPTSISVQVMNGEASQTWSKEEVINFPLPKNAEQGKEHFNFINSRGLAYEVDAVHRCLSRGHLEAEEFDSTECMRVMRLVSEVRQGMCNAGSFNDGET